MTRRVVCSAIRAKDGELLLGIRHYDAVMHRAIEARIDGDKFMHRLDEDQGFVDQHGEFMSRKLAYRIAKNAGQPVDETKCGHGVNGMRLYSEGLY